MDTMAYAFPQLQTSFYRRKVGEKRPDGFPHLCLAFLGSGEACPETTTLTFQFGEQHHFPITGNFSSWSSFQHQISFRIIPQLLLSYPSPDTKKCLPILPLNQTGATSPLSIEEPSRPEPHSSITPLLRRLSPTSPRNQKPSH